MEKNLSNEGKTLEFHQIVLALLGVAALVGLMGFAGWMDTLSGL